MRLNDPRARWPTWLEVESERRGTVTVRVSLRTWRQRFSFALFSARTKGLGWWERPIFFAMVLWGFRS